MAPWNGGSGFYFQEEKSKEKDPETGKKKKTGVRNQATAATKTVDAVLQSKSNRLCEYRSVLTLGKDVVQGLSFDKAPENRSEEHTSELQSLMRISYAVFCLKKKITRYKLTTA